MPSITLTNLAETLDIFEDGTADFTFYVGSSSSYYSYSTTDGHLITLLGTGIATNPGTVPISGTIAEVRIDLSNDGGTPDVVITGLSFDVTDLDFTASPTANALFWDTVLAGDTVVTAPNGQLISLYGDLSSWDTGRFTGGDDSLIGADVSGTNLVGDVQTATGGLVVGGDDTLDGNFGDAIGDVETVTGGTVIGGNDRITISGAWTAGGNFNVLGDVMTVRDGTLLGGDDVLTFLGSSAASAYVYGDAATVAGASVLVGGNDLIQGGSYSGATPADGIVGDSFNVMDQSIAYGGNDTIFGNAGNDSIGGDFLTVSGDAVVYGGNDLVFGGSGDDTIYGNHRSVGLNAVGDRGR